MRRLNDFILAVPYLFLMKVPYLWLPAVLFYKWPPVFSAVLCGLILLGLLAMNWQNSAWIERTLRNTAADEVYVEQPKPPLALIARNSLFLVGLSLAIAWFLDGQFGYPGWQWAIFAVGFMALYKKGLFFGRRITYVLTRGGLGLRYVPGHMDYRLWIPFDEISSVRLVSLPGEIPTRWTVVSSMGADREGLLITSKNPNGFTALFDQILLTSANPQALLQKFPKNSLSPS